MAYENMTYEYILRRMLDRVAEDYPNLDNREGSIIFNALAPAAMELSIMYVELDNVLNESFVDTASREYLLLACKQVGMDTEVFDANAGVHKAQFNTRDIPIGSRWSLENEPYNYVVTSYVGWQDSAYTYLVQCETVGTAPNKLTGTLEPITAIGVNPTYAKLVECVIDGEDETTDEDIREAYYEFIKSTVTDGNVAQYEQWCREYDGIGNYKIIRQWNGANSVKVSILDTSNKPASPELIDAFQDYLDPGGNGMGNGKAPIGSFVTVSTAKALQIPISAVVNMKPGYTKDKEAIDNAIAEYLAEAAYKREVIPYMSIGAVILGVEGVDRISDLLVNGGVQDIAPGEEEVAVLGATTWG